MRLFELGFLFSSFFVCAAAEAAPQPQLPSPSPAESPVAAASVQAAGTPSKSVENSVVKIFATLRLPDPTKPWTKRQPNEITASGAVISGKRILTNAHVVQFATEVQVQANQAGDKLAARVEAVDAGTDLALLKLEDETFFDSHPPLPFRKGLPDSKEPVMVYGYPTGGASLSITKGIISRIEFTAYNLSTPGLRIQIDAAINPGNSGGPAILNEEIVGIAFSHLQRAQNIGYIIPVEEIELFLQDIADGHFDGKPVMYDDLQTLENPALRAFLHLPANIRGMVVHRPFNADPSYPLREWDVITKIGDTPIDDQGMISVGNNLGLQFSYLVQKISKNDTVHLTIFRQGHEMAISLPLLHERPMVIPELHGQYPSYFIYGPLVFSEATTELLAALPHGPESAGIAALTLYGSPLIRRINDKPAFPGERLVVVPAPFFPHPLAKGYGNPSWQVVKSVNGQAVRNLPHLVELLRELKDENVVVAFDLRVGGETMVFPRAQTIAATESILTDAGIRAQGSPELMKVWEAK